MTSIHVARMRPLALSLCVVMAVTASTATAVAKGGSETPAATDVGVTADTVRIAVIADVDNPIRPGLFQGSFDAMKGFEKFINSKAGGGGLAGRKVVVDQIDSKLSADATRTAIIQACEQDFALVGTSALFLNNVDDMTSCVNQAGEALGIPDFPFTTTEPVHQCSPVSHPINPPSLRCDTIDDPGDETYLVNMGPTRYYSKKFKDLHGVWVYPSDLKSAKDSQVPTFTAQQNQGGIDLDQEFDVSNLAPQSVYTPVAQAIKTHNSTYARSGLASDGNIALRKEANLQGVTSVKVWDCGVQCYGRDFLETGGAAVEDFYVWIGFLPFLGKSTDVKQNKMLNTFVKYTGESKANGFGVQTWASALYFRDVVNAVVETEGVNGLTREAVIAAANDVNDFDAEGMVAPTDVGDRTPTDCFVLMQVNSGEFTRVFPKKKGTFSCDEKNRATVKLDLIT
jgi:Periplasmic binding protein